MSAKNLFRRQKGQSCGPSPPDRNPKRGFSRGGWPPANINLTDGQKTSLGGAQKGIAIGKKKLTKRDFGLELRTKKKKKKKKKKTKKHQTNKKKKKKKKKQKKKKKKKTSVDRNRGMGWRGDPKSFGPLARQPRGGIVKKK